MEHQQNLMIGDQRVNVEAMSVKVEEDIAFLQERLARMHRQSTPNRVVVKTYESMLASRQSVLAWLQQHCDATAAADALAAGETHTAVHKSAG